MSTTERYHYYAGTLPVLISIPHGGTHVPPSIMQRLTPAAQALPDTDWHVERLYAFAREMGCHMLAAIHSRYVIDLNRAPDNASLYPGKFTTGLCPLTLFDGTPIYKEGAEPDEKEVQERTAQYWQPYHQKLQTVIDELKATHKHVVVFDAHSICSQSPLLFEGTLADLNIGTADETTAAPELAARLVAHCAKTPFSYAHNGRFKGGYITRHYGNPAQGVHAVQLELAQCNYMQETPPFIYDEIKAQKLQGSLHGLLDILVEWAKES